MPASFFVGNQILNAFLRAYAPSLPVKLYVALHTADPGTSGANEVSTEAWLSYLRRDVAPTGVVADGFTEPVNNISTNTLRLEFGVMDGPTIVTVTHFALWDADVGGNLYFQGPLLDAKALAPTDECIVNPGKLQVLVT
jgi:hypothetical protein